MCQVLLMSMIMEGRVMFAGHDLSRVFCHCCCSPAVLCLAFQRMEEEGTSYPLFPCPSPPLLESALLWCSQFLVAAQTLLLSCRSCCCLTEEPWLEEKKLKKAYLCCRDDEGVQLCSFCVHMQACCGYSWAVCVVVTAPVKIC